MTSSSTPDLHTWTVSSLSQAIKHSLENAFPVLSVQGELSNCKEQSSGHWYFTLKDSEAQISAVMFRMDAQSLTFVPRNGDKVVVEGALNVYPPGGRYQIQVRSMHKQGLGELLLLLEQLKQKILKKGWFKKEHKKPLPFLPKRIGVVTSPTGAAIQDILNVLSRRSNSFTLILNPVKVQGEGAAQEIADAIRFFNEKCPVDVLIVGRGGGSFEDLFCFNEECVAEAIYYSRIPIICAVGHEIDHCIAEYVADMRAPTPSAAAEIVMAEHVHQQKHINQLQRQLQTAIQGRLRHYRQGLLSFMRHPALASPYYLIGPWMQKLDEKTAQFERIILDRLHRCHLKLEGLQRAFKAQSPQQKILFLKHKLEDWQRAFDQAIVPHLRMRHQKLVNMQQTLQAINPDHLLKKGFSILFSEKDRSVITNASSVKAGDKIFARLARGSLHAFIDHVDEPNE